MAEKPIEWSAKYRAALFCQSDPEAWAACRASALEEAAKVAEAEAARHEHRSGNVDCWMFNLSNRIAAAIRALIPSPAQEPRE
jgi:hypothetical protein